MARSRLIVVYSLLVVAEFGSYDWELLLMWASTDYILAEILLFLLYRGVKSYRSGFDNRLMRGLVQQNLIYFCCSFGWCSLIQQIHFYSIVKYYSPFSYCHSRHSISSGTLLHTGQRAPLTHSVVSSSKHGWKVCSYSRIGGGTNIYSAIVFRSCFRVCWLLECTWTSGNRTALLATSTGKIYLLQHSWHWLLIFYNGTTSSKWWCSCYPIDEEMKTSVDIVVSCTSSQARRGCGR